jgi:F-type H+-transporting ATPase subunit a
MEVMTLQMVSPDQIVLWKWAFITINATLLFTWLVMGILVCASFLITRRLSAGTRIPRWQNLLEVIVGAMREQIREVTEEETDEYMPFIGTIFLFILTSNLLFIIPGYVTPTASLTTTAALAVCVFLAVPIYGIRKQGIVNYLKEYFQPIFIFFPFHVMGEFSRTLALAVRLFGNMMSHEKVIAILLAITPLLFPVAMHILGLLIGAIQAYIFAILAMVYIASATGAHHEKQPSAAVPSEAVKLASAK